MAGRPPKVGLDYFELDCQMEDKIKFIQAEFGLKGFAIIVKLYQRIYGGFGYYCEWNDDTLLLFASENDLSSERNLLSNIVSACIRRDIFSKDKFDKYGILTSSGIQKRYLNATAKREFVELKKEYLLFPIGKNPKNVVINSISDGRNSISEVDNTQRKEKKRKEEKIKEENILYYADAPRLNVAFSDYVEFRKSIKKPMTSKAISLAKSKLKQLADNDEDRIAILEQSVLNGWQGLFPINRDQTARTKSAYTDNVFYNIGREEGIF